MYNKPAVIMNIKDSIVRRLIPLMVIGIVIVYLNEKLLGAGPFLQKYGWYVAFIMPLFIWVMDLIFQKRE